MARFLIGSASGSYRTRAGLPPLPSTALFRLPLCALELRYVLFQNVQSLAIFIPGNHDDLFREYLNSDFGQIEIRPEHIHVTKDGRRFLVIHGDEFDVVVTYAKWLAVLGEALRG